jgi:hypothetical protein
MSALVETRNAQACETYKICARCEKGAWIRDNTHGFCDECLPLAIETGRLDIMNRYRAKHKKAIEDFNLEQLEDITEYVQLLKLKGNAAVPILRTCHTLIRGLKQKLREGTLK